MVVGLIKEPNGIDLYVPANKIDELGMEIAEIETKTSVTVHAKKGQGLKTLVEHYSGNEINLLQGDFQVSTKIKPDKAVWGATKILAASTLVLYLFLLLAKGVYLDYKASHYSDEVSALFRDDYPGPDVRDIQDLDGPFEWSRRRWKFSANFWRYCGAYSWDRYFHGDDKL